MRSPQLSRLLPPAASRRLALFALFAALLPPAFGGTSARPNVLIILTDDQGMGDFSCHGNPVLKTPNLDRLHAEAVRFTDFHVAPMCTPTRGQLMTGLDAVRNGATSVTGGRTLLRPGLRTMPEYFVAAGYRTGIFGKWHLGDHYPHRPMDRGFQEAIYHYGWGFNSTLEFDNPLENGRYVDNGVEKKFPGYVTDFWFDRAMAWMKARAAAGEPFLCYLPTNAPHAPLEVPARYSEPYVGKGPANFFGMIANIDENMGRLDAFLRESSLRDNTIVVFMTDNGGTAGVKTWNAGLREQKTSFYDGGHRVPCWVRWPAGKLGAPRDVPDAAQVQDVLPTLLDLCGVKPPAAARFDGTSLARLLRGEMARLPERTFVVQYSRAKLEKWECAVVSGPWRLVHGKTLYDTSADRAQRNDLAAERPEIVARLRDHYERWWAELEPRSREFVPITLGAEKHPITVLTSADWQDTYVDNARTVRTALGGPRGSNWNVQVAQAGNYEISLSRWLPAHRLPLTAPNGPESKALPIAGAKLDFAGRESTAPAEPDARAITLRVQLPAGPAKLQAWFTDAAGQDVCGAFYATVRRLP
jgi:arylsulfatase